MVWGEFGQAGGHAPIVWRGMLHPRALVLALALVPLVVLACAGSAKDGLFVDAPLDAGATDAASPDVAAKSAIDATPVPDAAAPVDAHVIDAFAASCVPRDPTDGATRCRGSAECPTGQVCCAHEGESSFGATGGACSTEACDGDRVQLCTSSCECLRGVCRNAWPYEIHGSCG